VPLLKNVWETDAAGVDVGQGRQRPALCVVARNENGGVQVACLVKVTPEPPHVSDLQRDRLYQLPLDIESDHLNAREAVFFIVAVSSDSRGEQVARVFGRLQIQTIREWIQLPVP